MATAPPQDSPPSSPPPLTTPPPSTTSPPSSSPTPPSSPLPSSPPPSSPPPVTLSPPTDTSPPVSLPPPTDTSPPPAFSPPPPTTNASPPQTNQGTSPPNSNSSPPPPPPSPSNTPSSPPLPGSNGNNNSLPPLSPSPPPHSPQTSSRSHHSPPPPRSLGTPSSRSSSNDNSPSIGGSGGNNTIPIVIGVVVGVGALLILALLICCCVGKKKKKRRSSQPEYYTSDHSLAHNRPSNFYNTPPQHNWQSPQQPSDHHFSNLPPPPGINQGSQWAPTPPPQPSLPFPVGISSGEMGSNYSGPQGPPLPPPHPSIALGFTKSSFSYDELAVATGGFSQANLLGQGGFGYVHKGVLPNGKEIAVKSLKAGSGQGDREFQAEVEIISRVHHRHLVSLVGYCIAGGQKILVYEFVPNGTLEFHLYGKGQPILDWSTRLKIAMGSARGLAYLHEDCHPRIIHRDIKAANILIEDNFEAKVADFGLAKLSSDNYTHVSTRIMGTFGYLAPEYASSGKLTEKSDVFSFGVMLLELITGRRPVDLNSDMDESLVDWARPLCQSALETGNYLALADPRLEGDYDIQEMARMVGCASASVRHSARRRPKMSQIVRTLEGDMSLEHLNDGPKTSQSSTFSTTSGSSEIHDNGSYGADMKKFRKMALDSNEYTSSEYGHTSEYGLNPSSSSSEEASRTTGMGGRRLSP